MIKPVRLAPFKRIPPAENECEESLDSDQNEIEMIDETAESIGSSVCVSGEEVLLDSSPLPDFKNWTCLQQSSERIERDNSDDALSHFNTNFDYTWSLEADKQHENVQMKCAISPCSSTSVEKIKEIFDVGKGILKPFLLSVLLLVLSEVHKFLCVFSLIIWKRVMRLLEIPKNYSTDQF